MKKILVSLLVTVAAGASLWGATQAYFTSNKTISGNTLSTGTLLIGLKGNGPESKTYDIGSIKLEPGGETTEAVIEIKNDGNLNLGWFGYFNFGGNQELLDKVYIKEGRMEFVEAPGGTWTEPDDQFIFDGKGSGPYPTLFNQLAADDPIKKISLRTWNESLNNNGMGVGIGLNNGALKPGFSYRLVFKFGLDESADNTYQGKILTSSYTVKATQVLKEAIVALDDSDTRISIAAPDSIITWMQGQLNNQQP